MSTAEPAGEKRHSTSTIRCTSKEDQHIFNKHVTVNKTSKMEPGSILDDTEANELSDHGENVNRKMEPKLTAFEKGADVVTGLVHEKLTMIPRRTGLCIAITILVCNFVFIICMTLYSYVWDCEHNIAIIDAQWFSDENGLIKFEPYTDTYEAPTYVCGSFAQNETTGSYDIYCVLPDLNCEKSYQDERCPDYFLDFCAYVDNNSTCGEYSNLASVVSITCPTFVVAFGTAQAYILYVQLVLLITLYSMYLCCRKEKTGRRDLAAHLSEVVKSSISK